MLSLLYKNFSNKFLAADLSRQHQLKKAIRALSDLSSVTPAGAIDYKDDRRKFFAVAPELVRSLTEYASKYQSKDAVKLYEKALQYNVIQRMKHTGIITVLAYKEFADKAHLNSENLKLAQYIGWCVELMSTAFNMDDDIMDGSITRTGKPCWHLLEEVGLTAVNDSQMILSGTFHILKENFAQKDYYVKLLELVNETIFITTFGQSMDVQASKGDVTGFTMDRYKSICVNKATYLPFYLPIVSVLHVCGFTDPDIYKQTEAALLEIAFVAQIINDFNDCFGDPEEIGKIGTDIQENKCTWLAVVCMEKASKTQKEIMRECYGKSDPDKIARVKHLYEELGLPNIFNDYKIEVMSRVITQSQQNSGAIPVRLFKILAPFCSEKTLVELMGTSYI